MDSGGAGMNEMKCKRCGANENRIHGFCSMECETAWEYEDDIRDLTARIAELEAAQRWIPVGERLPLLRDSKAVLAFTKSGETYSGMYLGNNEWTGLERDFREGEVTHWMPLPEPLEVQE